MLRLITQALASRPPAPVAAPPYPTPVDSEGKKVIDNIFRGLVGLAIGGVGWMVITLPVMKDNLQDLKIQVADIDVNTKDRFTRADFLREIAPIKADIERNTHSISRNSQSLYERTDFMSETRADIKMLKRNHEDFHPPK